MKIIRILGVAALVSLAGGTSLAIAGGHEGGAACFW